MIFFIPELISNLLGGCKLQKGNVHLLAVLN